MVSIGHENLTYRFMLNSKNTKLKNIRYLKGNIKEISAIENLT